MQTLNVYIVVKDPMTNQDISIRGDFEILRAFLAGIGTLGSKKIVTFPAEIFNPASTAVSVVGSKEQG
jgi:hypothetical protein